MKKSHETPWPLSEPVPKFELGVTLVFFLFATVCLIQIKLNHVDQMFGDTAQFYQILENIAQRGTASNQLMGSILAFISGPLPVTHAAQLALNPLLPPPPISQTIFSFHAYLLLYPMAALVRLFPADVVVQSVFVLSLTVMMLFVYLTLRALDIRGYAAILFCFLVTCHPAIAGGLQGQFYPDRVFVVGGFLLMLAVAAPRTNRLALVAVAILCASINERAALSAGLLLIAYTVLYWNRPNRDRSLKIGLGIALVAYGVIASKYFLPANIYNGGFLPDSLPNLIGRFRGVDFRNGAILFVIVNCGLWILAWFEWRAALIAFMLMVPNIIGSIGGAEKVGWSTHYHDEYLPILIWAAMLGYAKLFRFARTTRRRVAFYGLVATIIVFFAYLNPSTGTFALSNMDALFIRWFDREASVAFSPEGQRMRQSMEAMRAAVPERSVVSTIESGMTPLYRNRTIEFFPVDIDRADYAVLGSSGTGRNAVYSGVVNFFGPEETAAANAVIVARMKRDAYDFDHPVFASPGLVVLKRAH